MAGFIALLTGILGGGLLLNASLSTYPPYSTAVARDAFKKHPNMLPPIQELILQRYRNQLDDSTFTQLSKEVGFDEAMSEKMWLSSRRLLDVQDYLALWRRGYISEADLSEKLQALSLDADSIGLAKKVTEFFPQPADLIHFAVREVYSPEIVEKFGQKEDLPAIFITEAAKVGVSKEQAENYWAAHWELPSPLQGFRMLHRRIVDEDTLKMLLKALDVMPFWRDKMVALSYNVLTRVDVRRMHDRGVLTDEQVYDAYLDVGYSPDNAALMLDFTKAYNSDENRGITRSNVVKAYKMGLLEESEMVSFFEDIGYSEDVIGFWVDLVKHEVALDDLEEHVEELLARVRMGYMSLDDLRDRLSQFDLPSSYINKVIAKEELARSKKIKMPGRSDIEKWLDKGVINDLDYYRYMKGLGYQDFDIRNYLVVYTLERDRSERKYLPVKTYQEWFKIGIMDEAAFTRIAKELNISDTDIQRMISEVQQPIV